VSVGAIALLAESGWRGDRVLRLTAEHLNGLPNAPTASGPTPDGEPKYRAFMEATRLLHELRLAGVLDFEYETRREPLSASLPGAVVDGESSVLAVAAGAEFERTDDGSLQLFRDKRTLVMRFRADAAHHPDAVRFRELLRLDPQRRRFDVVELEESDYDPFDPDRYMQELAIDSRSLMGVLYYLSHGVEVHPEDLQNGTVTKTVDAAGNPFDWTTLLGGLFEVRMHEGRSRPQDAALAIRHRDRWFYLADGDQSSRTTFLLVASLFTLQAGDVEEMKPVLTLPVSR
jgi:hypothetical protein